MGITPIVFVLIILLFSLDSTDRSRPASNAVHYAKFRSRSHDAVPRVYDEAGNVIRTQQHKGDFKGVLGD